jgi:hypothetical protein
MLTGCRIVTYAPAAAELQLLEVRMGQLESYLSLLTVVSYPSPGQADDGSASLGGGLVVLNELGRRMVVHVFLCGAMKGIRRRGHLHLSIPT